jgi:hypothetical protein
LITHNDAPQSAGLNWTSDQLVAETSTWQHTNIHAPGGIRTHNRSRRAAADLRFKSRSKWDRRSKPHTQCEYRDDDVSLRFETCRIHSVTI